MAHFYTIVLVQSKSSCWRMDSTVILLLRHSSFSTSSARVVLDLLKTMGMTWKGGTSLLRFPDTCSWKSLVNDSFS